METKKKEIKKFPLNDLFDKFEIALYSDLKKELKAIKDKLNSLTIYEVMKFKKIYPLTNNLLIELNKKIRNEKN